MSKSPTLFLALFFLLLLFVLAVSLPASQVTRAQSEEDWITWEDYDSHLLYSPGWRIAVPHPRAIGGQLSYTSTPGASLTFQLQVTEATGGYSIRYASGPDGGTFEVRVNNTVRQYSSYSETEMYNREITDGSLPAGTYTITVMNGDGTFWLEAVQVKGVLAGDSPLYSATPTPEVVPVIPAPPAGSMQVLQAGAYVIVHNATELVAAIENISSGGPSNIYLESGDYTLTDTVTIPSGVPVHLYGTQPITVYAPASDGIHLTGPTDTELPMFYLTGDATLHLHHLRLSAGVTGRNYAGVIWSYGTLHLSDSVIENTETTYGAGGIYNEGSLSVIRSAFRGNKAGGGGAIQNQTGGTLTAQCALFQDNEADYGGAVLHASDGTMSVSNSRFEGNTLTGLYSGVESRDIHNLGYGNTLPGIQAGNNEWVDGPGVDDDNGDGATIQTSPALSSNPLLTPDCQIPEPEQPPVLACDGSSQTDIDAINSIAATLETYNVILDVDPTDDGCWTREKANIVLQAVVLQDTAIGNATGNTKGFTDFFQWDIKVYMSIEDRFEAALTCVAEADCDSPLGLLPPERAPREIWIWENGNTDWRNTDIKIFGIPLVIHELGHILSDDWRRDAGGVAHGVDLRTAFRDYSLYYPHIIYTEANVGIPVWKPFNEGNPSNDETLKGRIYNTSEAREWVAEGYMIWVLTTTQTTTYYNIAEGAMLVYIPCKIRDETVNIYLGDIIQRQQEFWSQIFTEDIPRGSIPSTNVCSQNN